MATSEATVQQAIYAALSGDSVVSGLVTGLYDLNGIPEKQPFPFVVLGETTEARKDIFGKRGSDITIMLHMWSNYQGKKQVTAIHNAIHDVLDNHTLTLVNHVCISCQYDNGNTSVDDSTTVKLLHRVDRYRIITEEV